MPAGNAKFLMDSVFELAQRINRFGLADAEIGLFCSVVIIAAGKKELCLLTVVLKKTEASMKGWLKNTSGCATKDSVQKPAVVGTS